jgi:hypothetical protein
MINEIVWTNMAGPLSAAGVSLLGTLIVAATRVDAWRNRRAALEQEARVAGREVASCTSELRTTMLQATSRQQRDMARHRWWSSVHLAAATIEAVAPEVAEKVRALARRVYADLLAVDVHGRPWPEARFQHDSGKPLEEVGHDIVRHCCGRRWRKRHLSKG